MAGVMLGMRGFEMGSSQLNTVDVSSESNVVVSSTQKHTGNYALAFRYTGSWGRWRLSGNPTNPSVSLWVYLLKSFDASGTGTKYSNIRFRLTDGTFVELRWNAATHTYDAYVNGTLFKAGTIEVSVNTWFHVQFYAQISNAGRITVLIDGHVSIDEPGDTLPASDAGCDYVYVYGRGDISGSNRDYIDDLVYGYGGLFGDRRVYEKRPSADTALVEWTPSTGVDHYVMENETPPNDANYNEAITDGLQDELELSALDITDYTCTGVCAWARAKMTDGVGDSIDVGIDSNGTDSVARSPLSTAWEYYWGNVEEVDPADSAAWTQGKLDALLSRKVAVIT